MSIAVLISVCIHTAGFLLLYRSYEARPDPPPRPSEPIVLDLQPEPAQTPRHLIEPATPVPEPPPPTQNIAEVNAEAMDRVAAREDDGPLLDPDQFDELPGKPAPPTPPVPASPPPPPPPKPAEQKEPEEKKAEVLSDIRLTEMEIPLEAIEETVTDSGASEATQDAPIKIAQAQPLTPERPALGKSRKRGGVSKQGTTNFDAIQSEIAPYLANVRKRVERRWNEMLYTRYSGTNPVQAVIDCAINPEGELVSVTVVGTDNDRLYSALCRDAIIRAGPFGPFTFEVPAMYREKNLEIQWTFNFL